MVLPLLWLVGCSGSDTKGTTAGAAAPVDAEAALAACDERVAELALTCRVEAAARAGRERRPDVVNAACARVEGRWAEECHFRAAEELAKAGMLAEGLAECSQAGSFTRFCVTHVGWGVDRAPGGPDETTDPGAWVVLAATMAPEFQEQAAGTLGARWWFLRFYGSGQADPAAVADSPEARGAWALEAVRLAGFAGAAEAWAQKKVLQGESITRRVGRYDTLLLREEGDLPRVQTFGGASRLVGESATEDMEIALWEALFFEESSRGDAFLPGLEDPRPRVRYTAIRLYRILPSSAPEATLRALLDDPDPIVRAHAEDGLKHRTWMGKGVGSPGGHKGP